MGKLLSHDVVQKSKSPMRRIVVLMTIVCLVTQKKTSGFQVQYTKAVHFTKFGFVTFHTCFSLLSVSSRKHDRKTITT